MGNPTALNQIPQIYRRCEVIALSPGSHCRCLHGTDAQNEEPTGPQDGPYPGAPNCLNYINLISWWSRLWPRQEFMYATKIHIDWAKKG